jgi:hypothetical protein
MLVPGAPKDCSGQIALLESLLRLSGDLGGHSDGRITVPGARGTVNALVGRGRHSCVTQAGAVVAMVEAARPGEVDIRRRGGNAVAELLAGARGPTGELDPRRLTR